MAQLAQEILRTRSRSWSVCMKTIRRLIYGEVLIATSFVLMAFLSLFFFFDFVEELGAIGRPSRLDPQFIYGIRHALLYVGLLMPNRVYELLPICVLIGSVAVLARLAQSSEYTILRTSGLGPWKALRTLLGLGLIFVALTFVIGDYVAPTADKTAQLLKARYQGKLSLGQTGAWLKERQAYSNFSVNVGSLSPSGEIGEVRIFEFDNQGLLVSTLEAERGQIEPDNSWKLQDVTRREFDVAGQQSAKIVRSLHQSFLWPSSISAEMVSVALLKPDRMRATDLYAYVKHLEANGQTAQRYEIEFWRKVFYPLSCLVMVVLALPFAYLHFRAGGITGYVFGGVMIGISFFLLNNVFGYIGNLNQWQPWLAAASPSIIYSFLSLGAFGWLVLRR
jgi:lipopolysaccharide export system permease protein